MRLNKLLEAKARKPRPIKALIANHFQPGGPPEREEAKLRFGKRTYKATPTHHKGKYYEAHVMVPPEITQEIENIVKKEPTLLFDSTRSGTLEFNWYDSNETITARLSARSKQQLNQLAKQSLEDSFPPESKFDPGRYREYGGEDWDVVKRIVKEVLATRKNAFRNMVRPHFTEQVNRGKAYAKLKRTVRDAGDDQSITLAQINKALKALT